MPFKYNPFTRKLDLVNPTVSGLHNRLHGIDSTLDHIGVVGSTQDNFMSFDIVGLPQDSGYSGTSFESYVKHNTTASGAPTVNDDDTQGYSSRSLWFDLNMSPNEIYRCVDATTGTAVWLNTSLELDDLGSIATQDADNVNITGGDISNINNPVDEHGVGDRGFTDGRYYTQSQLDSGQLDNRYYTETEVDNLNTTLSGNLQTNIDGKSDTGHTHIESDVTDLDKYTQAEVDALTWTESDITDLDKYTQSEVDTISGSLQTNIDAKGDMNDVADDTTPQLSGFLDANGHYIQMEKGGDVASANPLVIDTDGDYFDVTGTTNFASMTVAADRHFFTQFDGILTMTHHTTNLDLPGEANITTAAGDVVEWQSTGANTVQCVNYTKADGTAVVAGDYKPGGTDVAIADGGTGAGTATAAFTALKQDATEAATGVLEKATTAEVATGTDTARAVTPAGIAAIFQYDTTYIDAAAMVPCTTNGALQGTHEYGTNDIDLDYFAFDGGATEERTQFKLPMLEGWDRGTIKVKFFWSSDTTSSGGDTVEWGIKAGALSDSDSIDAALGTEQVISDVLLADDGTDIQVTAATPALTVGGTPALGDMLILEVYRNTDGTDDMVEDAFLFGVWIQFKKTNTIIAW